MSKILKRENDGNLDDSQSQKKPRVDHTQLPETEVEKIYEEYKLDQNLPPSTQILRNDYGVPQKTLFLQEADAGILEYMDKNVSAVSGIIKHRFTDFFVNEIDKKDNVVRLTDIGLPEDELVESREKARLEAEKLDVKVIVSFYIKPFTYIIYSHGQKMLLKGSRRNLALP